MDTIFALSSGSLPSGVAVVRVSGPAAADIAEVLTGSVPPPRQAMLRTIRRRNGAVIDQALLLFFPAPASFTGEDCLELHLHGGRAVVRALFEELSTFPGTRLAEAGEFTLRAFENGKLNLVEAEGLADLIRADTEMQRKLAVEHSRGGLSALYQSWMDRLTHARAMIEAELDFADEDDVPGSVSALVWVDMRALADDMASHLAAAHVGEIIRDGFEIVILGAPNAGKSTLLNWFAKRDVAIVTPIPGTTRDVLSVDLDISGYAVRVSDTAGLREASDVVEQEGIRRAVRSAEQADLLLVLEDLSTPPLPLALPEGIPTIRIGNKLDEACGGKREVDIAISLKQGLGLEALMARISAELEARTSHVSLAIPSRIRHVNHIRDALNCVTVAAEDDRRSLDLRAEELRMAANAVGRVTGRVDVETLLGVIFSEFCIGK